MLNISAMNEELDPWGPTEDEVLCADIAAVMAAWGNDPINTDNEASVVSLEEEDMDIGLINAPEAVDLISTVELVKMISILLMIFDSNYCTICSLSYNSYMILICSMHLTAVP